MKKLIRMLRLHKAGEVELDFERDECLLVLIGMAMFVVGGMFALVLVINNIIQQFQTNFSIAIDETNVLLAMLVMVSGAFMAMVMVAHALKRKVKANK